MTLEKTWHTPLPVPNSAQKDTERNQGRSEQWSQAPHTEPHTAPHLLTRTDKRPWAAARQAAAGQVGIDQLVLRAGGALQGRVVAQWAAPTIPHVHLCPTVATGHNHRNPQGGDFGEISVRRRDLRRVAPQAGHVALDPVGDAKHTGDRRRRVAAFGQDILEKIFETAAQIIGFVVPVLGGGARRGGHDVLNAQTGLVRGSATGATVGGHECIVNAFFVRRGGYEFRKEIHDVVLPGTLRSKFHHRLLDTGSSGRVDGGGGGWW